MAAGKTFDEIKIGDSATKQKTITAQDIDRYAQATDDFNPIHMDEAFARTTKFGGRIAHGPMTLGIIAPVIGMELPGDGCLLKSLNSEYLRPVMIGDTITARAEVVAKNAERRLVELKLRFTNQRNEDVILGTAEVYPRRG